MDLFTHNIKETQLKKNIPLALKLSPKDFEGYFGQEHLLAPGKLLRRAIESDRLGSVLFYGPPGTGKSALARMIARKTNAHFSEMNAVTSGVSDLRKEIEASKLRIKVHSKKTIIMVDEIHHFNKSQQDALLPDVEKGNITLIGITTENPFFYVNAALRSRSQCFEFFPLERPHIESILNRALVSRDGGLDQMEIVMDPRAKDHLIDHSDGDARRLLNALEIGINTTLKSQNGTIHFTLGVAEESLQKRALLYDKHGDEHYDTTSAFIKSMRGSDPDAAIYWMAKMLEAGEDPRFIARRIVICASEDVGNADPLALQVSIAALQSAEFVGMPEARIPLAQAALYVASAPKSNACYVAIGKALSEIRDHKTRAVPNHLKDGSMDKNERGHGKGYLYPHNFPGNWVHQEYMPEHKTFYEPSDQGMEKTIKKRLQNLKEPEANRRTS